MVVLSAEHRRGAADYFEGPAELVAGPSVGAAPPDRKLFLDASIAEYTRAGHRWRARQIAAERRAAPNPGG
jgi:hypothetical protein